MDFKKPTYSPAINMFDVTEYKNGTVTVYTHANEGESLDEFTARNKRNLEFAVKFKANQKNINK